MTPSRPRSMEKKAPAAAGTRKKTSKKKIAASVTSPLATGPNDNTAAPQSKPSNSETERPPPPPIHSIVPINSPRSFSKKSSFQMKPTPAAKAAAKLSLPWPPQQNSLFGLAMRKAAERKRVEATVADIKRQLDQQEEFMDQNGNANDDDKMHCCGNKSSCCCGPNKQHSKGQCGQCSRKLYMKKKSQMTSNAAFKQQLLKKKQSVVINGDSRFRRKSGDPYLPVTIPPFQHVHTGWPGFDHKPTSNWRNKYLMAKPWPYQHNKQALQKSLVKETYEGYFKRFPTETLHLSQPLTPMDMINKNFSRRSLASTIRSSKTSLMDEYHGKIINKLVDDNDENGKNHERLGTAKKFGLPKQRIQLEQVGSEGVLPLK